ncbi:TMEM14 family protein [Dioscorea alata]|uniref:TMEM14 family protein n=1 Tax=Dioscorea alata TaxID=55571 RepID=A0ACB7U4L7_DIOAL|nr:TMEM14 family protein [Dioscorea alata]
MKEMASSSSLLLESPPSSLLLSRPSILLPIRRPSFFLLSFPSFRPSSSSAPILRIIYSSPPQSRSRSRSRSRSISAFSGSSDAPPTDLTGEEIELKDINVSGGGGDDGGSGNGGGGGRGKDESEGNGEGGSEDRDEKKMGGGMSMSQKLTLGYAALVGVGGIMGYIKSGSQKSLAAGGLSALLLYYVHTQLPIRPAFASALGLGYDSYVLLLQSLNSCCVI